LADILADIGLLRDDEIVSSLGGVGHINRVVPKAFSDEMDVPDAV
jgi:hypothetical protein